MSVNIQIKGIPKVTALLALKNKETMIRANDAVKKAGFFIQSEVVASIAGQRAENRSVDTGFFMNSILAIFPKQLIANIGSNKYPVKYANSLEYNPSIKGGPRRHFNNTKIRNELKVKEFINKEIKKIK